jgi:hypothetical protein
MKSLFARNARIGAIVPGTTTTGKFFGTLEKQRMQGNQIPF